jgi:hypothetical protein
MLRNDEAAEPGAPIQRLVWLRGGTTHAGTRCGCGLGPRPHSPDATQSERRLRELCDAIGAAERARLRDLARELATACEIAREVEGDPLEARFRAFERTN